jgi:hypothetical protein
MNHDQWQEIYRESRRNAPVETPPSAAPRRAPVPVGELSAGTTVIRPIGLHDENEKS